MNLIDKLEDMGLIEKCYDCGHKSFHPIWWIKSLFKKLKKHIPNPYSDISQIQSKWVIQELLKRSKPLMFIKFSEERPLPYNNSEIIKFRRYKNNETLD